MKKVSIITPCFNVEESVSRFLESCLNQSIGRDQIEIICIDDASTDHTLDVLKEFEAKYPELIILIPLTENRKQGFARNMGMQYANGETIVFVDADDWLENNALDTMYKFIQLYNCDIIDSPRIIDKANGLSGLIETYEENQLYFNDPPTAKGGKWPDFMHGGFKMYRTSFLKKNQIRFAEGLFYEDNYFGAMATVYCSSYCQIMYAFYHYVENLNSTMHRVNDSRFLDRLVIEKMKLDFYKKIGIYEQNYNHIMKGFFDFFYFNTMHQLPFCFEEPPFKVYQYMVKEIKKIFPDYLKEKERLVSGAPVNTVFLEMIEMDLKEEEFQKILEGHKQDCINGQR